MLKRLIYMDGKFIMLYNDGSKIELKKDHVFQFLKDHKNFHIQLRFKNWKNEADSMESFEADTVAYVNDYNELCIPDMTYFKEFLIDSDKNVDNLMSVNEYADKVGRTKRQILFHLTADRIPGAIKFGRDWMIPKSSVEKYPEDNRITTGKYIKR